MRASRRPWTVLVALALVAAIASPVGPAPATKARGPQGLWQGTIQGLLRLVLHVQADSLGRLTGTLDSPDQGAMGLPIDTIELSGDSLRFEMTRLKAVYRARIALDGVAMTGQWSQAGLAVPLDLKRIDRAPEVNRPQEPRPPYPYRAEEVSYENARDGVKLAGTLTIPHAGGPFPAALLITGSGPENRDEELFGHRPFLVLADHLTRSGIAVLRVDDRGVGGSTGSQRNATSEDFAADVLAGVAYLKGRRDVDPKRVGLIGHSEGGLIAPMAAVRSRDVAYLVLMAGPGVPGDSMLVLQNAALLESAGMDAASIVPLRTAMRRALGQVAAGADSAAVFREVRALVNAQLGAVPPAQRAGFGSVDSLAVGTTRQFISPWMRFFVGFDPRPTLARVTVPVLAINGERDLQVVPRENLAGVEGALKGGGNRDVTVKELPGLNHLFQRCTTCTVAEYAQLEETIAPSALEEISRWILARTSRR